jgi:hypothetical protein
MMRSELTAKDEDTQELRRDRAFTGAFALLVTALACSIVLLLAPRPTEPHELPALRLARAPAAAQLARDRELASQVAKGADVEALLALYLAEGLSELEPRQDIEALSSRRAALGAAARTLFDRIGAEGMRSLLAATTERAMSALRNELPEREAYGLLGRFPALLLTYGFVAKDGTLRAPELSVRAFYKARFNLIGERTREADLSAIELQALEGFNALHAVNLAPALRARAARAFYVSGGRDSAEALAIWQYQGGAHGEALALLRHTYEQTGALRLRNMALFAARH